MRMVLFVMSFRDSIFCVITLTSKEVINMYTTICLICKKEFAIPFSDFRYKDIKYNRGKNHVCNDCGKMVQEECQKTTGLNPDLIDLWDKILRTRSI